MEELIKLKKRLIIKANRLKDYKPNFYTKNTNKLIEFNQIKIETINEIIDMIDDKINS